MLRFAGEFGLTPVGAAIVSGLIEHDGRIECARLLARATVHNVPKAQPQRPVSGPLIRDIHPFGVRVATSILWVIFGLVVIYLCA
jgi:hypothetical protein